VRRRAWTSLLGTACLAAVLSGCASQRPVFDDGPVAMRVDDARDIPEPAEQEFWRLSHHISNFTVEQARLRGDPVPAGPARDVNRLGEVPDSSWYVNRTGSLTPLEVGQGPGGDDPGPEAFLPWEVTGVKAGGRNPGFVFQDARGVRYICKFDKRGEPVVATGAGAVAARLLWACGYNVPDDRVVLFERGDLGIAAGAKLKNVAGDKRLLTTADVDALLARVPSRRDDGRYRALVSRYLPGRPVGGFSYRGIRGDDPNDRIDHQDRRSLRGLRVFGAWLNHVDQKIDNTLDVYVEEDGRRFLRHYLVDFDGCLGGYWSARHEPRIGFAYDVDMREFATGVLGLGLRRRPYESLTGVEHAEVGLFEDEVYDPATWRPNYLNAQLEACRPADAYWAGTVLAQVTDEMIAAAVAAARYDDPAASEILTRVLVNRRDRTVAWAVNEVTPVTGFGSFEPHAKGWTVPVRTAVGADRGLRFEVEVLDVDGRRLWRSDAALADPTTTISFAVAEGRDYLVVRWWAVAGSGRRLPATEVHYRLRNGIWSTAGVLRDDQ